MPTFEQFLLSAPIGFVESTLEINKLSETDPDLLKEATADAWNENMKKPTAPQDRAKLYINQRRSLVYIIRSMKTAQPTPSLSNAANALVTNTCLTQQAVEIVLLCVKELSKSVESEATSIIKNAGKLSNFQYKIGVAISSNICKNLFEPFISIRFDVTGEDGTQIPYTAELTLDQFKEFKSTFEKVAKVMDTV